MDEPRQIATIREYSELVTALRKWADQLGTTLDTIDEVAGLPARYTAKLIGKFPVKRIGHTSLGPLLYTLGLKLVLVVDEEALAKMRPRLTPRKVHRKSGDARYPMLAGKTSRRTRPFITVANARALQCAWVLQISPKRRRKIAKIAAKTRWKKGRSVLPTKQTKRPGLPAGGKVPAELNPLNP